MPFSLRLGGIFESEKEVHYFTAERESRARATPAAGQTKSSTLKNVELGAGAEKVIYSLREGEHILLSVRRSDFGKKAGRERAVRGRRRLLAPALTCCHY